jgi:hypothetical protein
LKPLYETFLEKKVQEVASQAVAQATGLPKENIQNAIGISRQDSQKNATSNVTRRHGANGRTREL